MIIVGLITKANVDRISTAPHGMSLSTKFGIDDEAYVMHENKIHKGKVVRIDCIVEKTTSKTTILYTLHLPNVSDPVQFPEDLCFKSKKALKDSL